MLRFIRAFFIALRLTLRGEAAPVSPHQPLLDWIEAGAKQAGQAVSRARIIPDLWRMTIRIEGREQSVETILKTVQFHMETEYPYMMQRFTNQSVTAIHGTNMNDQFALSKLLGASAEHDTHAIQRLADHLNAIPPSISLQQVE